MTKEEAREEAREMIDIYMESHKMPIHDVNIPCLNDSDNGYGMFSEVTFKGLLKIAYDLEDKKEPKAY